MHQPTKYMILNIMSPYIQKIKEPYNIFHNMYNISTFL